MEIGKEFRKYAMGHHGISSLSLHHFESSLTPYIIEERQMNMTAMDVFSRLMMDRIIFLGTGINDQVANIVQAQLLFLESADAKKDIQVYINSPGGSVHAGLGLYDTMQFIQPDIAMICTGMAASMAAVLLCAGTAGKRTALKHSRVMIHQPMGGAEGQASDIAIHAEETLKIRARLNQLLAKHTGQPEDVIAKDTDRDNFMSAERALEYGIVDKILGHRTIAK